MNELKKINTKSKLKAENEANTDLEITRDRRNTEKITSKNKKQQCVLSMHVSN